MSLPATVINCPAGAPQLVRPNPGSYYCLEAIPAGTGSILIERSEDNGTTYTPSALGSVATVNTIAGVASMSTILRVSATTAAGTAVLMTLSNPQVGGGGPEFIINGVPYTTQVTLTTELELFAVRFPAGSLKLNFRLELDYAITCTNNVNVKTLKHYFGNSANTALEGGTIIGTQLATSSSGQMGRIVVTGRNDGATIDAQGIGVTGSGWGLNTTAPISVASGAVYSGPNAVEQALVISYQKATAADALVLQSVIGRLYQ
jgi:hypothetical protein